MKSAASRKILIKLHAVRVDIVKKFVKQVQQAEKVGKTTVQKTGKGYIVPNNVYHLLFIKRKITPSFFLCIIPLQSPDESL